MTWVQAGALRKAQDQISMSYQEFSFSAKIEKGVYVLAEVGSFDPGKYVKVVRLFNILLLPKLHKFVWG